MIKKDKKVKSNCFQNGGRKLVDKHLHKTMKPPNQLMVLTKKKMGLIFSR